MKFKKLRKIYRILIPLQLKENELFRNQLKSNPLIKQIGNEIKNCYSVLLENNLIVFIRNQNHSDYNVFKQIFNFEEYKIVASILQQNVKINTNKMVFIDAGANVGYVSVYFSRLFNNIEIYCIEPSLSNVELIKMNIESLDNVQNIKIYQNALSGKENLLFDLENNFRDGKDWSIATKENKNGVVNGITINEILIKNKIEEITVLKIDIEGAERFIFDHSNDLSFLKKTKIIAIEIHDEFLIRDTINHILKENNFLLLESGELTIGINIKFIE